MKQIGGKNAKDLIKVFQEIFKPNHQNVHMYIAKMSGLAK